MGTAALNGRRLIGAGCPRTVQGCCIGITNWTLKLQTRMNCSCHIHLHSSLPLPVPMHSNSVADLCLSQSIGSSPISSSQITSPDLVGRWLRLVGRWLRLARRWLRLIAQAPTSPSSQDAEALLLRVALLLRPLDLLERRVLDLTDCASP